MADVLQEWLPVFGEIGRDMFLSGLVSSHAGNLSVLVHDDPDHLVITRTGAMLGRLKAGDLVVAGLDHDENNSGKPSSEIWAHRAIYRHGNSFAVAHAHPPHAVALSFHYTEIDPINSEGQEIVGRVPVLDSQYPPASRGRADDIAQAINSGGGKIVLVRGHGVFATAETLERALMLVSTFEESCKIMMHELSLRQTLGRAANKDKR